MRKLINIALFIILVLGHSGLNAQNAQGIDICKNKLKTSISNGVSTCDAIDVYAKCFLRLTSIYKSSMAFIRSFQKGFDSALARKGVYCDTDIIRLANELKVEDNENMSSSGIKPTNQSGLNSQNAEGVNICTSQMKTDLSNKVPTCEAFEAYVKCFLRITGTYKSSMETVETFVKGFVSGVARKGIHCEMNAERLVEELNIEESQNGTHSTIKPIEQPGPKAQNAKGVNICTNQMRTDLSNKVPTCDAVKAHVKCYLRITGTYKFSLETVKNFVKRVVSDLARKGIRCEINVVPLVEELKIEESQHGSNSIIKPTGYNSATTDSECLSTFLRDIQGRKTCRYVPPYAKCIFRILRVNLADTAHSNGEYRALEEHIQDGLNKAGLDCLVDVQQLLKDFHHEAKSNSASQHCFKTFQLVTLLVVSALTFFILC